MCATCGCSHGETRIEGKPAKPIFELTSDKTVATCHHGKEKSSRLVQVERDILDKNNELANLNRNIFKARNILAFNLVSSPGSGKTTLLVKALSDLKSHTPIFVIEGDQETCNDAERIRATGVSAVQINTGRGCHLDAGMVNRAVEQLKPAPESYLFIENVGNLVCPAAFDLGETARIVVISITEGEDKPLKYPDMFASADLVLINKIDLLPHLIFDINLLEENLAKINRNAVLLQVSATTGQGMDQFYHWLGQCSAADSTNAA